MRLIAAIIIGLILIEAGIKGNLGAMIAAIISPKDLKSKK